MANLRSRLRRISYNPSLILAQKGLLVSSVNVSYKMNQLMHKSVIIMYSIYGIFTNSVINSYDVPNCITSNQTEINFIANKYCTPQAEVCMLFCQ